MLLGNGNHYNLSNTTVKERHPHMLLGNGNHPHMLLGNNNHLHMLLGNSNHYILIDAFVGARLSKPHTSKLNDK